MRLVLNNQFGHRIADANLEYFTLHTGLNPVAGSIEDVAGIIKALSAVVYDREVLSREWDRVQEISTLCWYMERQAGFGRDMSWSFEEGEHAIGF